MSIKLCIVGAHGTGKTTICRKVLIVFDDILGSVRDSKIFKDLISTHRHYNISVIFSIHFSSKVSSSVFRVAVAPFLPPTVS